MGKVSHLQPGMGMVMQQRNQVDLDDDTGNAFLYSAQSKAILMQKLTRDAPPNYNLGH